MPKSPEELEKMFQNLSDKQANSEKEFKQQLEMAQRDTKQFKDLADKNAEELRIFKQDADKRDKEHKEALAKKAEAEVSEFVEAQVKAGRIIPALKEKLVTFMKSLTSETEIMKFTEKNGAVLSHTQISLFKELITSMKPVVPVESEFSIASEEGSEIPDGTEDAPVQQFTEILTGGEKKRVPVDGVELAAKAFKYQEEHFKKTGRQIGYDEALIALSPKKSKVKA